MSDTDYNGLKEITDSVTNYYNSLGSDKLASQRATDLKGEIDGLLKEKFQYGLERQNKVSELIDKEVMKLRARQASEERTEEKQKKHGDQIKCIEAVRDVCLSYAQKELLRKVSDVKLTNLQVEGKKDNFVLSAETALKAGETRREKRTLQKTLFLKVGKSGDGSGLTLTVDDARGFLSRPRARGMLIKATVDLYNDPKSGYAGGTFTLTDGNITDAEVIIGGLIAAGAKCRIEPFGVNEWSQNIKSDRTTGGNVGHNDKLTQKGAISALDALNDRIAKHNRLLDPKVDQDKSKGEAAHVNIVKDAPSSSS